MTGVRRFFVLDLGCVESDLNWVVPMHSPATAAEPERPATWERVPTLAFLIDHEEAGWILFDTGCHPDAMTGHWPASIAATSPSVVAEGQSLPAQLALLDLTPSDISTVVCSHLHLDHAGGLFHFAGTAAGRGVVVAEREFAEALVRTHERERPYGYGYIRADFDIPGISWSLLPGDWPLADGVRLLSLPGHTAGTLGLLIELPRVGSLILPSDTVYTRRNYGPPLRPPASVHDSVALRASVARIRELERSHRARLVFSHDVAQYAEEFVFAPKAYE